MNLKETPLEELREAALKHYDEIAGIAVHWRSDIPQAITFYYNQLIAIRDEKK